MHAYKRERQGPLIGTRTAGAVSAAAAFAMPGGNLLYLAVTGLEVDGEIVEGVGVAPDIEVPRPLPYAHGADPVIEAAVSALVHATATGGDVAPAGDDGVAREKRATRHPRAGGGPRHRAAEVAINSTLAVPRGSNDAEGECKRCLRGSPASGGRVGRRGACRG